MELLGKARDRSVCTAELLQNATSVASESAANEASKGVPAY
jgi:hypothetical protein